MLRGIRQGGSENERGLSVASQFVGDHCRDDRFVMMPPELHVWPLLMGWFLEQVAEVKEATMFGVPSPVSHPRCPIPGVPKKVTT